MGASRHKPQAEVFCRDLADSLVGYVELAGEATGGGFGREPDIETRQLTRPGKDQIALTVRAVDRMMDVASGNRPGLQHNLLLHMLAHPQDWFQVGAPALGAALCLGTIEAKENQSEFRTTPFHLKAIGLHPPRICEMLLVRHMRVADHEFQSQP